MAVRTDARDRMLRTAAVLFRAQGYHATGLNQVLAESGAPKGSLYFHFPGGKEQLAAESIELAGAELCSAIRAALASTADPATALDHVLALLGDHLVASDFRDGCPVATVALDAGAGSEPIRTACVGAYDSWQSLIADHLRAAGIASADDLATVLLAAIEGALLLARTRHDLAPLRTVGAHLRLLLALDRSAE
ncbi:TetR family transcriptional regulator [Pseudonocardia sp.]|jgi:TetR/AcrR family transcriptional repressor of lmrAB and yxaGH operons|uniref:TetR/AcrR family transcriptional regulator n=1 Tax=Pseudonocardia sp. TaxID=60912 RepID=UPI002D87A1F0|nr:TetR family transcriptional regulator [Pseudonocardia sp.]